MIFYRKRVVNGETNRGAAYVFQRVGTTWTLEQRLLASDGTAVDQFGSSVAIDGGRVLVGAKRKPIDGMSRHGAAYFFERRGSTWTEVQQVLPSKHWPGAKSIRALVSGGALEGIWIDRTEQYKGGRRDDEPFRFGVCFSY